MSLIEASNANPAQVNSSVTAIRHNDPLNTVLGWERKLRKISIISKRKFMPLNVCCWSYVGGALATVKHSNFLNLKSSRTRTKLRLGPYCHIVLVRYPAKADVNLKETPIWFSGSLLSNSVKFWECEAWKDLAPTQWDCWATVWINACFNGVYFLLAIVYLLF